MNTAIIVLLVLGLCLGVVMGLISALQKLKVDGLQDHADSMQRGPEFRDHSAGEQSGDQQSSRSQFAWQSRSHSRPPD